MSGASCVLDDAEISKSFIAALCAPLISIDSKQFPCDQQVSLDVVIEEGAHAPWVCSSRRTRCPMWGRVVLMGLGKVR